ncbi:ABC transporter substrate-binding protein [Siccirubricoccus deserti]|uniref:ABC transporter substrate-binding protein n=1 Tax=Siccirubricoccus deserti TaxID=2013562 RepID=A0A9X0UJY9_9PROT|nr:ABC transporter substrate-binding protein [Siccirubricoccus deserti]MBC4018595.1 ABC transporter substrate-binding protein [Siccirubricoccus deserti]GGC67238.1 ABC transporter substrate-binding protein [Siccirubricoccus deserti]
MHRRALLALPALLAAPTARAAGWPRVLQDGLGRLVEIPAPPRRIVAIFASNVEMLAALGLLDRIIGIEAYTRFPPEVARKPLVGGRLGFSVEAIARLAPDLVVMTPARQAAHALTEPLARLGVPTIVVTHRDLAQVFGNIALLGQATGAEAAAAALLAGMQAGLDAVTSRIAGRPAPRVFLETSTNGRGAFGTARQGSYTFDIVSAAGGRPALPELSTSGPAQVSGEAILRADPEVYLLAGRADQATEVPGRPGFDGLRAIRDGRLHAVSRAELLIPGPRVIAGVQRLARLLHPDAFAAPLLATRH